MDEREADSAVLGALNNLELGDVFTLCDLIEAVEAYRATRIKVREFPEITPEDGLYGIWMNTKFGDFILHAPTTSALHRRQIILHELAHMILDHDLAAGVSSAPKLFPDLSPDSVVRTLTRGHEDSAMERDAESLADVLAMSLRRSTEYSPFQRVFG